MRLRRVHVLVVTVIGVGFTAWTGATRQTRTVDDAALKNAAKNSGEWLTVGRDYAEQRYSPLTQINAPMSATWRLAWSFEDRHRAAVPRKRRRSSGQRRALRHHQLEHRLCRRCADRQGAMAVRSKVDRTIAATGTSRLCCGVISRGIALYRG